MKALLATMLALAIVPALVAGTAVASIPGAVAKAGEPFGGACRPVVTQPYGPTTLIGEPVIGGRLFHTGVDLACPLGTPVHSVTDGMAHVTEGWGGGFGNNVVVQLVSRLPGDVSPQTYFVRYAHLLPDIPVPDGSVVHAGQVIGFEGSSGFSTGAHLHFEVDRGRPVVADSIDPAPLVSGLS